MHTLFGITLILYMLKLSAGKRYRNMKKEDLFKVIFDFSTVRA